MTSVLNGISALVKGTPDSSQVPSARCDYKKSACLKRTSPIGAGTPSLDFQPLEL